jgi:hypothetical protein
MSVIAFNFTKITAERKPGASGRPAGIKANTGLTDVSESPLGTQKALRFVFSHQITYQPNLATILLEGELLVLSSEKEVKETVASFKKNKTMSQDLTQKVYNSILAKANIEALILAKELNLPPPFRLPHIAPKVAAPAPPEAKTPAKKK